MSRLEEQLDKLLKMPDYSQIEITEDIYLRQLPYARVELHYKGKYMGRFPVSAEALREYFSSRWSQYKDIAEQLDE